MFNRSEEWRHKLPFKAIYMTSLFSILAILKTASAQQAPSGILIMAHGGTQEWNTAVQDAVADLQKELPTVVAFGMAERESLQHAIAELEMQGVRQIAVVRLFISGASFLHQTEYLLGLRPDPPAQFIHHGAHAAASTPGGSPQQTAAINDHSSANPHHANHHTSHDHHTAAVSSLPLPVETASQIVLSETGLIDFDGIAEMLRDRAAQLSRAPEQESILILAHGAGDDQENTQIIAKIAGHASSLEQLGTFRAVRVEALREDWPEKRKDAEARIRAFVEHGNQNNGRVIVIPFRLFGFGPYEEVLAGLGYVSNGQGLLPHPLVAKWIKTQAQECFTRAGWRAPFLQ